MSLRNPLSGLKKKMKRRLAGGGHEPERGPDVSGERVDETSSLPQQEHLLAEGEHDRLQSGNKDDADGRRVGSTDPLPHSDDSGFVPVDRSGRSGGEREAIVEGREADERNLHVRPGIEDVVEGEPNQEGNDIDGGKISLVNPPPESMQTTHFQPLPLIASSGNVDDSAILDHAQQVLGTNQRESGAADENKPSRKSTLSANAKSTLLRIKESSYVYPPLKSIAESLCFILDNFEV